MPAAYKLSHANGVIVRIADGAMIPVDAGNRDFQEYQAWLAGGNEPDPAFDLSERRVNRARAVEALKQSKLDAGAPYGGKLIQVDDSSRSNIGALVLAATLTKISGGAWSDVYAQGWITMDNTRLPFPDADHAIAMGVSVGTWYAAIVQAARDIKDVVLASADPDAENIEAGWPA